MQNIMGFSVRLTVAALVAVSYSSAFGFWEDKSGEVKIPAGETYTVAEEDVGYLANVTKIIFGSAKSVLKFTNAETTCILEAPLVGDGTLDVENAKLVLAADNSGYLGATTVDKSFGNGKGCSTLVISNRYGLGTAATPKLLFRNGATIKFGGDGLTNDVAIGGYDYNTTFKPMWDDETGVFVQNNDLTPINSMSFRNAEITKGVFGKPDSAAGFTVVPECTIKIEKAVHFVGGKTGAGGTFIGDRATIEWATQGTNVFSAFTITKDARFICQAENALHADDSVGADNGYIRLQAAGNSNTGYLDLNGYDQSVRWIDGPGSANYRGIITSAVPAKLTFTRPTSAAPTFQRLVFRGQVSFEYAGAADSSYGFIGLKSTSTGGFAVSSGTFTLDTGFGWAGTNVVVSGGNLILKSTTPFTDTNTVIRVTGGKLTVGPNVVLKLRELTLGTKTIKYGMHLVSSLAAQYPGFVEGDDTATVMLPDDPGGGAFVWPEAGEAAELPVGKEIVVTDEDAAKVAALTSVMVPATSTLRFANGETPLTFATTTFGGAGDIRFDGAADTVLLADNRAFHGAIYVTNSTLVVSNRFGLGMAQSVSLEAADGILKFGGNGLTNDVQIYTRGEHTFPGANGDGPFVMTTNLQSYLNVTAKFLFDSDTVLTGGILGNQTSGGQSTELVSHTNVTLTIGENVRVVTHYSLSMGGKNVNDAPYFTVRLGTSNLSYTYLIMNTAVRLVCMAPNVLLCPETWNTVDGNVRLTPSQTKNVECIVDLNGCDQKIPFADIFVYNNFITSQPGDKRFGIITSAVPAMITFEEHKSNIVHQAALRFDGAAGLHYTGLGSEAAYTNINQFSSTKGDLIVDAGTFAFDYGAGWGGTNVTVSGTGKLVIGANAAEYALGGDRRSETEVRLSDQAILELHADTVVKRLYVDGETVPVLRGTYGGPAAGLDAAHTLDCLSGTGTLRVRSSGDTGLILFVR